MQKIQFDYFTGMEAEQYSFYRVPKVLFTESCFKALSCEAKVLYGLMLDRMSLSIKNRWLDSEDRVYIIFTVEEIAELMNCGTQKAVKLVKELDSNNGIGLIEKKRLGLGKPNVIYVKNFMIREVPDQKPTGNCADLQSEQEDHKKIADLQSKQKRHEECADLQQEAENKGKTGISLNCENHHSGVVKTTIQDCVESQLQNGENHNSGMMKTTNQEFSESQFQNGENHHSRIVEITKPEYPKSQSNITPVLNWQMTRDGSDFGYLLSIETDDSGTLSLSGSGQIDGGKLNGTYKIAQDDTAAAVIEVKDYDTESAKEGYLNGNYTITFPADSSEDTDSSLSMLENFALVLDLNSAKDSGSVALSVESAGSTLGGFTVTSGAGESVEIPDLTALGDVYDVTNEDDMSAYAATLDLTTLMDNLSNAGVPDEVITYVLSGGSNSDAEDVTDENASEAESDAESAEAGAA